MLLIIINKNNWNGIYLYVVDILVSSVSMHLYYITYKPIYKSCNTYFADQNTRKRMQKHTQTHVKTHAKDIYTHSKMYTNKRENAYKLCKMSYKCTQMHLQAYKNTQTYIKSTNSCKNANKRTLKMTQINVNNYIGSGCMGNLWI